VIGLYKTVYECEVITPMFLRGGDNKTCDIRPPAIKGAMRFWFRAFSWKIQEKMIREIEEILFGGTNGEGRQAGQKSPFGIHVDIPGKIETISVSPTPYKGSRGITDAIKPGVIFTVELYVLNNKTIWIENKKLPGIQLLKMIDTYFERMALFGGLGMRSRRGFGAFKITKKNGAAFSMNQILQTIEKPKDDFKFKFQTAYKCHRIGKKKFDDALKLVWFVGEKSHEIRQEYGRACDRSLGSALGMRLASPIIVSAIPGEGEKELKLIMTSVYSKEASADIQKKFMDMLDGKRY